MDCWLWYRAYGLPCRQSFTLRLAGKRTVGWHNDKPTVPDATLRNKMLGKMADRFIGFLKPRDFHTCCGIEMPMQRRYGHLVMIVECIRETLRQFAPGMIVDVDQCCRALLVGRGFRRSRAANPAGSQV